MCGICGKYNSNAERLVEPNLIKKMTRSLLHRGPDDEQFFFQGNVGFGVRRLSIVDQRRGQQPFYNESKSICGIYNGEIYNHVILRNDLIEHGHLFYTNCDGEVIVHLYEEGADCCLESMHGMYALAIYDICNRRLLLARDRVGIKPLYYCSIPGSILFASELRAILLDPEVSANLDPSALQCYFAYNYWPEAMTPFLQIRKLLPGHCLIADSQGVRIQRQRVVPYRVHSSRGASFSGERFHQTFRGTVQRYLSTDVPVGVFLSGGLDSSYLAYTASEVAGEITTYTIGFKEKTYDERRYARLVSRAINSKHYEIEISSDIVSVIRKMAVASDVPLGEPSLMPTFELSAFAKRYCGVALSGEGADELFLGYDTYKADQLVRSLFMLPLAARTRLVDSLARLIPRTKSRMGGRFLLELISRVARGDRERMHYGWREVFSLAERQQLCLPDLVNSSCSQDRDMPYELFQRFIKDVVDGDYVDRVNAFDLRIWLPDSVLHRVDMASMFHGLEVRVPYLDDAIVDLVAPLPRDLFLNRLRSKYSIKQMLSAKLPPAILNRPKQGFSVPVGLWLRDDLAPFYDDLLSLTFNTCGQLINYDYMRRMLGEHHEGKRDHGRRLWNALMFILWYDLLRQH